MAAKVRNENYITVTSLGDCGVAIFRPIAGDRLKFVYETFPGQHAFNAPYQCGTNVDNSNGVAVEGVEYMEGDIIVAYSDGFADNVYRSGYYQCLEEQLENGLIKSLSQAADCLARKAYFLGKQLDYLSPFHVHGRKSHLKGQLIERDLEMG